MSLVIFRWRQETEDISHSKRRPSSLVKPLRTSLMKRVSWFGSIMFFFYFLPFLPCLYTCACKTSLYFMIAVVTIFQQCQLFHCLQSMLALPIDIILCTSSVQWHSRKLNGSLYLDCFFSLEDRCIKLLLVEALVVELSTTIPCPAVAAPADPCTKHIIMESFTSLYFINKERFVLLQMIFTLAQLWGLSC